MTTTTEAALIERIERLERDVARQRDLLQIQDVLTRYSRALDWLDDGLLASVFFDDAEIDYGFFRGRGREFRDVLMKLERECGKRWHGATLPTIQLDGDRARVETYQFSVSTPPGAASPQPGLIHAFGFYADVMERREGRWGIAARKHLLVAGNATPDISGDGLFGTLNHVGTTSPAHPDYLPARDAAPLPHR